MSHFDSNPVLLSNLLGMIQQGKIQLPDFQRGWVWDDAHIQDLIVSIMRTFPVGAVMLLETGGETKFQTRPVEGLESLATQAIEPQKLILDGQQRLTTLTQVMMLEQPVLTRTAQGKSIKRYYYIDIQKAVDNPLLLDEAIVAVDENRELRSDFGRKVDLSLSSREAECELMMFPCNQIFNHSEWLIDLQKYNPGFSGLFIAFLGKYILPVTQYHLPVIELKKEIDKEAVCLVFEKVNTGGVSLSVFELITATYAAENYNLRDDWFGSDVRNIPSRQRRIQKGSPLLADISATDILQAVTILHTYDERQREIAAGKSGHALRPVSAKRVDMLKLPLSAWKHYAGDCTKAQVGDIEKGFKAAADFLTQESFYRLRELPYSTQLIPLAAVMAKIGNAWRESKNYVKLARWFWCGVLGELYGGAVETRIANDFEGLLQWFDDDTKVPKTVNDAFFQPERLDSLRTRNSAAYKGINVLILRQGARDWFWNGTIQQLDNQEVNLDIHHIFPKKWCKAQHIARHQYDSILNKTPLSYKANKTIGGSRPSDYLVKLRKKMGLNELQMDELLESHALSPALLRADDFERFIEERRQRLVSMIADAMGKSPIE